MYSIQLKNRAVTLRKSGKSIHDIADILNLKPTTISNWCKNILLTKELRNKIDQQGKLKARAAMLIYTEKQRRLRLQRVQSNKAEGAMIVGSASDRDILMIGLGLYWGEGYKYENSELGFTNSNLSIINFYIRWLRLFNVRKDILIFRLTINEVFRAQERRIKQFWIRSLKVKENQFSATTFIKTNLKKADVSKPNTYLGILRVKVRKGTNLRDKIIGALEHISSC
jgi:hypothetical protein